MNEQHKAHSSGGENVPRLLWIGAILVGSTMLVVAAMYLVFALWSHQQHFQAHFQRPAPPTLEFRPQQELATERARQRERLQGYRWLDRRAGIAQIPIDRAMQLWRDHHAQLDFGAAAAPARAGSASPEPRR